MAKHVIGFVATPLLVMVGAAVAYEGAIPGLVSLGTVRISIERVKYTTKVEFQNGQMTESQPDKYRMAVVTLRLEKPAGTPIVLHAADLTLHYSRRNGEYDVAPCEALSSFSANPMEDRVLNAPGFMGPGWVRSKTGSMTTEASTVYADAVFAKIEPDADRMWIFLAQPADRTGFRTEGW